MRTNAALALVAYAALCAFSARAQAYAQAPSAPTRAGTPASVRLVLRPGDVVRVEVNEEPSLKGEFAIGSDGHALMPGVGLVRVANRPFEEVDRELRSAYAKEFTNLVVRLTPLLRIAVLGEVRQPGLYLIDATHTLTDVLARAGGFTPSANPKAIDVVHADGQPAERLDATGGAVGFALRSGDQVRIERRSWVRENLGIFVGAAGSIAVAVITGVLLR